MSEPKDRKSAVVTGAGGGIGRSVAERLLRLGYEVILVDNNLESLTQSQFLLPSVSIKVCDVRKESEVQELSGYVEAAYGDLDVLVNAAGVFFEHDIATLTEESYDLIMDVNVKGIFLTCKHLIPLLQRSGDGKIVNISSSAGLRGSSNRPIYSASKAAVIMMTKSIARDYGSKGIRANVICPGLIDTPMADWIRKDPTRLDSWSQTIPAGRIGSTEDVASGVEYLISEQASYLHGHALVIDGGGSA